MVGGAVTERANVPGNANRAMVYMVEAVGAIKDGWGRSGSPRSAHYETQRPRCPVRSTRYNKSACVALRHRRSLVSDSSTHTVWRIGIETKHSGSRCGLERWPELVRHCDCVGRPQQLRPRQRGRQVCDSCRRRDVDPRRDKVDDRQMLAETFLHLVEEPLAFRLVG
jgi:hypothetical protein